jgi:hypothetical protein
MVKAIDLFNEQHERDKNKNKIYKKIYKRIESKIIQSSSMNLYKCWYDMPEFLFNIPLYNIEGCKEYLKNKLKDDGFSVYFTGNNNNIIVISWNKPN